MSQVWRPPRKPRRQTRPAPLSPRQPTQAALKACSRPVRRVARGERGRRDTIGTPPRLGGHRPASANTPRSSQRCSPLAARSSHCVPRPRQWASSASCATQPQRVAIPCPATTLNSVLQQRPLRGTWARRSPVSGMPVPVFLHDVERVPSSEFSELLLLADEQLYLFNTPICSNRLLNSGRRL